MLMEGIQMAYQVIVSGIQVARKGPLGVALLLAAQWERTGRSVEVMVAQ